MKIGYNIYSMRNQRTVNLSAGQSAMRLGPRGCSGENPHHSPKKWQPERIALPNVGFK